jgi:hypothetical protein
MQRLLQSKSFCGVGSRVMPHTMLRSVRPAQALLLLLVLLLLLLARVLVLSPRRALAAGYAGCAAAGLRRRRAPGRQFLGPRGVGPVGYPITASKAE